MAKHLKSRAPRTLVMDGSFARYADQSNMFPNEVLSSPDVDILSYHHYGDGEARRVKKECEVARRHNKVYVSSLWTPFPEHAARPDLVLAAILAPLAASSRASTASSTKRKRTRRSSTTSRTLEVRPTLHLVVDGSEED